MGISVLRVTEVTDFIHAEHLFTLLLFSPATFHDSSQNVNTNDYACLVILKHSFHVIYSSHRGCRTDILQEKDFVGRNDFELQRCHFTRYFI